MILHSSQLQNSSTPFPLLYKDDEQRANLAANFPQLQQLGGTFRITKLYTIVPSTRVVHYLTQNLQSILVLGSKISQIHMFESIHTD